MKKKYIDAENFKRRVMESAFEANKPDLYDIAKGICEMVDYTSAADVAPVVHGCDVARCPSLFECSVCGWRDTDTLTGDTSTYNYCPNCGAKMDGGEQDG